MLRNYIFLKMVLVSPDLIYTRLIHRKQKLLIANSAAFNAANLPKCEQSVSHLKHGNITIPVYISQSIRQGCGEGEAVSIMSKGGPQCQCFDPTPTA